MTDEAWNHLESRISDQPQCIVWTLASFRSILDLLAQWNDDHKDDYECKLCLAELRTASTLFTTCFSWQGHNMLAGLEDDIVVCLRNITVFSSKRGFSDLEEYIKVARENICDPQVRFAMQSAMDRN